MRMLPFLLTAALAVPAAAQVSAVPPQLTLEQSTALRCSAAFAIVAADQAAGDAKALAFPPLAQRGREFFVRASAQLMDETGVTRADVAALLQDEAQRQRGSGTTAEIMPACLLLLDASGL
jgi:hypothetical protein